MKSSKAFRLKTETKAFIGREVTIERFLISSMAGYFPVLNRDPDGTLAAIVRYGDIHVGQAGALGVTVSRDDGESWTRVSPVADEGSDMRNPGFGITSKGTWIVSYIEMTSYENGFWKPGMHTWYNIFVRRSTDKGETWSDPVTLDPQGIKLSSPYGKIVEDQRGILHMSIYGEKGAYIFRSTNDGKSWGDPTHIAEGYNETGLLCLPGERMLAFLRSSDPQEDASLFQAESSDAGYTWSSPHRCTGPKEHPADVIRLSNGNLLFVYGHRTAPFGVWAMLSRDEGKTWDRDHIAMLVADSSTWDCGYPSSVELKGGRIFTAYYAIDSMGTVRQGERYPVALHAAGVRYPLEIFEA
ncbi:MAG TPA: sialidase family protein [Spirochaetia bacterium]|nr:sialidase family protein [Spirochaetia bacterium]